MKIGFFMASALIDLTCIYVNLQENRIFKEYDCKNRQYRSI